MLAPAHRSGAAAIRSGRFRRPSTVRHSAVAIAIAIASLGLCACTQVKVYPAPATPVARNDAGSVVVQPGDSLYGIASRHGVPVLALAQENGIAEPFVIHPGQRLRLHAGVAGAAPDREEDVRPAPNENSIVVQRGDSLYGIASRNRTSVRELAQANALSEPFRLHPGQRLRLPNAAAPKQGASTVRVEPLADTTPSMPASPNRSTTNSAATSRASTPSMKAAASNPAPTEPHWQWPADGALLNMPRNANAIVRALDIAGSAGSPVRAAAAGTVVYAGAGSPGYEQLIVIAHGGGWTSSYAHCRRLLVVEGRQVATGAVIAEMGRVGATRDMVHFELRRGGDLVDPRSVLPKR